MKKRNNRNNCNKIENSNRNEDFTITECYRIYKNYLTQVHCYKCSLRYALHVLFSGAFFIKTLPI